MLQGNPTGNQVELTPLFRDDDDSQHCHAKRQIDVLDGKVELNCNPMRLLPWQDKYFHSYEQILLQRLTFSRLGGWV